eukprot:1159005-Pelagomonas_calceolata.AAC.8
MFGIAGTSAPDKAHSTIWPEGTNTSTAAGAQRTEWAAIRTTSREARGLGSQSDMLRTSNTCSGATPTWGITRRICIRLGPQQHGQRKNIVSRATLSQGCKPPAPKNVYPYQHACIRKASEDVAHSLGEQQQARVDTSTLK